MALTLRSRVQRGVPVLVVAGPAEPESLGVLADDVDRAWLGGGPIVLDLSDATLIADPALRSFLQRLVRLDAEEGRLRLVCSRSSGRKALRLCCAEAYGSVFGSVDLAVDSCLASEPA
jgi:hypothetical protein